MYLIREVFNAKPGKAKELVKKFKQAAPHFEKSGEGKNFKIMTDAVGNYWTVVFEFETDDMGKFFYESAWRNCQSRITGNHERLS